METSALPLANRPTQSNDDTTDSRSFLTGEKSRFARAIDDRDDRPQSRRTEDDGSMDLVIGTGGNVLRACEMAMVMVVVFERQRCTGGDLGRSAERTSTKITTNQSSKKLRKKKDKEEGDKSEEKEGEKRARREKQEKGNELNVSRQRGGVGAVARASMLDALSLYGVVCWTCKIQCMQERIKL
ncbi:hypothetical protein WN51_04659 [Melipona quadrifasciata]|uniref:Uncharacterized protein n=1 Tax=Melipona quadrifasciata TaxID=166423 RepID=A0A0N0U452_9HYME|nr:hypothetical protein WN51_04659 [Melipona quadrifasciata]